LLWKAANNRKFLPLLALIAAFLLWLGWPTKPIPLFLFFGLVPLFLTERIIEHPSFTRPAASFFKYAYLTFVLWNAFTTYWVSYSTLPGGIAAVLCNALLMCIPAMLFYFTKRRFGPKIGYPAFLVFWIAFEYFHLDWDLTWPWLTFGNGFAQRPEWVQWYEFTGFMGGSVWLIVVNILFFKAIADNPEKRWQKWVVPTLLVIIPIAISYGLYFSYQEKGQPAEVVVVQPNIDPYNEKFPDGKNFIPIDQQQARLLMLSESMITPNTKLVVWPETAMGANFEESRIDAYPDIAELRSFVARHPELDLLAGINSYQIYPDEKSASVSARFRPDIGYYDVFNTGMYLTHDGRISLYHKSKLVPGVEKLPYPKFFKFLGPLAIDLGGMVGTHGTQEERTVFFHSGNKQPAAAPVICYESIYGGYVSQYVKNGASLICIITNDGWWSNSPGYKQHLQYATLRAIENRRSVARAANTGISGFINQRGDFLQKTEWWKQAALRQTVLLNTDLTLYSRTGEIIGPAALILSGLLLLVLIFHKLFYRKRTV
jgi:apolipoprotein N-acyltransferase